MKCGTHLPIMTNNCKENRNTLRLPAEWERQAAVLLSWPHENTDWNYMLEDAERCYIDLVHAVSRHAVAVVIAPDTARLRTLLSDIPSDRVLFFDTPTNDTWIRDYGVITASDGDGNNILCDFGFNAWGGKFQSSLDNGVTRRMYDAGLLRGDYRDLNNFILEGGSIESDGRGTLLTTSSCLLTPTRNSTMSQGDIEAKLAETLGASKVLWLDKGDIIGDDTDGHIDTIARLAPHDTILYCGTGWGTEPDEQSAALEGVAERLKEFTTAEGRPFNLIELPLPAPVYDPEDGHRLPATYANFLILNDAILLPVYGQPDNDRRAEMALRVAFPDHEVECVNCLALIRQHGSLHCATMQLPEGVLPL